MKLLKRKILLTLCFGLFSGCLMFANAQQSAAVKGEKRAVAMVKQVGLSQEQKAKVAEIFTEVFIKTDELKGAEMTPAERKKANREIGKKLDNALKETLTAEQFEKLMDIRKKRLERERAKKQ